MEDVCNSNFRLCGQIMAVSIVQGGPTPNFLDESVYNLLCNGGKFSKTLTEGDFTAADREIFENIRGDVNSMSSYIIDSGYNGIINEQSLQSIIQTVMTSLLSRRRTYLEEVADGLNLFGLFGKIVANQEIMKTLFVQEQGKIVVDSSYVVSLLKPQYSPDGSTRRIIEERFLDYLQDFINNLEDLKVDSLPEGEVLANDEGFNLLDGTLPYDGANYLTTADLTTKGFLGWCTGQKHRPLFNEDISITVEFNHNCFDAYPNHKICFPVVSSSSRNLSLPTQHCTSYSEFKSNFLMAFSKGQAFGRS